MPVHGVSLRVSYAMTIIIMRMWLNSKSCLQPSCSLSVNRLLRSELSAQVHLSAPLHFFSESIGSAAVLYIFTSLAAFLHYVSSAVFCQLSCCSVLCHVTQTSCKTSAQLESASTLRCCLAGSKIVVSAAICLLSHDVSSW